MLVLGRPFLQNSNITVDYENGRIGLTNGKDLNPVKINYAPRVIILFVVFSIIAMAMGCLVTTLNKEDLKIKLARAESKYN